MKHTHIFLILVLAAIACASELDLITGSGDYFYGRGESYQYTEANHNAIVELCKEISITVQYQFEHIAEEKDFEVEEYSRKVVESYSNVSFTDTLGRYEYQEDDGKWVVYRYIEKAEKDRIFDHRRDVIFDYVRRAKRAERDDFTDNMLRDYYWALVLLYTHPDHDEIKFPGSSMLLKNELTSNINQILSGITIEILNRVPSTGDEAVNIRALYNGTPLKTLRLFYSSGSAHRTTQIQDGIGTLYLQEGYLDSNPNIKVNIDYTFDYLLRDENQRMTHPLSVDVLNALESGTFPRFTRNIKHIEQQNAVEGAIEPEFNTTIDIENEDELIEITHSLYDAVKTDDYDNVEQYFSEDGFTQFRQLMDYGDVRIYEGEHEIRFQKYLDQMLIRSIPVVISLDNGRRIVNETLIPIIKEGRITWTNFGIYDEYIELAEAVGDTQEDYDERMTCLTFMEYYKTIFAMKDDDRIEDIFRDDAMIFTGYVKRTEEVDAQMIDAIKRSMGEKRFKMVKHDKKSYMKNLREKVFLNPVVNIQFAELEVTRRCNNPPVFAMSLYQDYYSSSYADRGYLMLVTDNSIPNEPKIFYRYWQPDSIGEKLFVPGDLPFTSWNQK